MTTETLMNDTAKEALKPLDYGFTKTGYRVEELVPLLPFGRSTLWKFISSGELPIMRFGRSVTVASTDITDLLNKRRGAFSPYQQNTAA